MNTTFRSLPPLDDWLEHLDPRLVCSHLADRRHGAL